MKKTKQRNISIQKRISVYTVPFLLLFAMIPMIVKVKFYENPLVACPWYPSEEKLGDLFLYYKTVFIGITAIAMLALLAWQVYKMKSPKELIGRENKIFVPLIGYTVLMILSFLFSEYKYICLHGMPEQFESIWMWLSYVVILVYSYYVIRYKETEKTVLFTLLVGVVPACAVCVLQYFKVDIYRIIFAEKGYHFVFPEGMVYGSFFNSNYVGYYTLLLIPVFAGLFVYCKDVRMKLVSGVLSIGLIISMIGASSDAAMLGIVAVAGFVAVFLALKQMKTNKIRILTFVVLAVAGAGVTVVAMPYMNRYIQASNTEKTALESIFTNDENVEIHYKGNMLLVQMQQDSADFSFVVKDQNQQEVENERILKDNYYCNLIRDERFDGMLLIPLQITNDPVAYGFAVQIGDKNWFFSNQIGADGTYYYYTDYGVATKLTTENVSEDFAPLVGKNALVTDRGFIWNKSLTRLKDHILLGSGADTFAFVFPNDDYVDKYNNNVYDNKVITKPHSLYLQIAIQNGVLALVCFLIFYGWYLVSGLRIYFKQPLNNLRAVTGFAILLGTMGYMIAGTIYDSSLTVAPIFWAFLGLGIGINQKLSDDAEVIDMK